MKQINSLEFKTLMNKPKNIGNHSVKKYLKLLYKTLMYFLNIKSFPSMDITIHHLNNFR